VQLKTTIYAILLHQPNCIGRRVTPHDAKYQSREPVIANPNPRPLNNAVLGIVLSFAGCGWRRREGCGRQNRSCGLFSL